MLFKIFRHKSTFFFTNFLIPERADNYSTVSLIFSVFYFVELIVLASEGIYLLLFLLDYNKKIYITAI